MHWLFKKLSLPLSAMFLLFSCQPIPASHRQPEPELRPPAAIQIPETETPEKNNAPAPSFAPSSPRIIKKNISGIYLEGVEFDSRAHQLTPIDQPNGPGSKFRNSRDAASKNNALLAINAGFFTPEGNPLGLVISNGQKSGSWNSASSLGTAIYRIDPAGRASISRRNSYSAVSNSKELLQAGPLLIEKGRQITGLNASKSALRVILLSDGQSRWWIGITSVCSLADLGQALSKNSPTTWKINYAMNLDGGSSSDLYISSQIPSGSIERSSFLNRKVRNFLILKAR